MTTQYIEKSAIEKSPSNGGLFQQALFKENGFKFKFCINTDNYDFQSYAKLYMWTNDKGFDLIINKELKQCYGDNPNYVEPSSAELFFKKVSDDLIKIAKDFVS